MLAGRYRIERLIGAGGMAEVFEAEDTRLGRRVAVKVLRPELAIDPAFRERFEGEARAAARLSHPNLVAVYDVGEDPPGRPFIVMELLTGGTLAQRLQAGPLPEAEAIELTLQVLAALDAAHAGGIVHRDIKPANILFSPDGSAKVADFGIAKAVHPDADLGDLTATSKVIGTPRYLPPERADGRPATPRSDLWGAGVLLHEALTGAYPFPGETPLAAVIAAQRGLATPLAVVRPDVSPAVASVADRALAPDPGARYSSAREMAADLATAPAGHRRAAAGAVTGTGTAEMPADATAAAAGAAWEDPSRPGRGADRAPVSWRRRPMAAALAAAALAVLLLALLWPGGGAPSVPARSRSTTRATTPTTQAPTTTTITCAGLQAQRQALAQQQGQVDQHYRGRAQRAAASQAIDNALAGVDQQIQQDCPRGDGGGGDDQG